MLLSYAMDRKEVLMKTKLLKMTIIYIIINCWHCIERYRIWAFSLSTPPPNSLLSLHSSPRSLLSLHSLHPSLPTIHPLPPPRSLLSLHSPLPTQTQHYKKHREKYVANKPRFSNIIFINTVVMPLATRRTNRFPYDPHVCDSWSVSWLVPWLIDPSSRCRVC